MNILINRIKLGLGSVIDFFRVSLYFSLLTEEKYLSKKKINVIISGTTYPARVKYFESCLKSLLLQSVRPAEFIIYLSQDEFPQGVPSRLAMYQRFGVKFEMVAGNVRSYKKLLYAVQAFPERAIITVDDDVYYPENWLEKMTDVHNRHPDDVLFYRGHLISFDDNQRVNSYKKMLYAGSAGETENIRFLPTGVCGILYPAGALHSDFNDLEKIFRLAPSADDIWFKAMATLNNRRFRRIYPYNVLYPPVLGSQKFSLTKINVSDGESENDRQLSNTFNEYALWKKMHD